MPLDMTPEQKDIGKGNFQRVTDGSDAPRTS